MDIAVQLDHPFAACPLMKPVDVLGDQQKFWGTLFQPGQGEMSGIRLCFQRVLASPRVPVLDEFGIALKRFSGRKFFRPEFAPETSLGIAKGGKTAFGRNTCASERNNASSLAQFFEQRIGKIHGENDFIEIVSCSKRLIMSEDLLK